MPKSNYYKDVIKRKLEKLPDADLFRVAYEMVKSSALTWNQIKKDPSMFAKFSAEEEFRVTKMPLPRGLGYPIPHLTSSDKANDFTEEEINKMRAYTPMDKLETYSLAITDQLETIMKSLYSTENSGAIFVAPAGWGKSHVFKFFGAMAAQHSLLNKELWMKNPNESITNSGNYFEQHFVLIDTPTDLSLTAGLKGKAAELLKEVANQVNKHAGQYTFIFDELYDALANKPKDDDVVQGFTSFKTLLGDSKLRVVGVYATENAEEMKRSSLFDGQWGRRLRTYEMRDYNAVESFKVLRNSFDNFCKSNGLPDPVKEANRMDLFKEMIHLADQVGPKSDKKKWGFPDRIQKVIQAAALIVKERMSKFDDLKTISQNLIRINEYSQWFNAIITDINSEKRRVETNPDMSDAQIKNDIKQIEQKHNIDLPMSIRDPKQEALVPMMDNSDSVTPEDGKGKRVNDLNNIIEEVRGRMDAIQDKKTFMTLKVGQLKKDLNQQYGEGFAEDGSDIANIKIADIKRLTPQEVEAKTVAKQSSPEGQQTEEELIEEMNL